MRNARRKKYSNVIVAISGWIFLVVVFLTGCSTAPTTQRLDSTPILAPTSAPSEPSTPSNVYSEPQQLRVINQSNIPVKNLIVRFPEDQIVFGDVSAGSTTAYKEVPNGVYRYAAYNVEVDGKEYQQVVVDWVMKDPMPGKTFTYILEVDPQTVEDGKVK